jgi:hypothetical protein
MFQTTVNSECIRYIYPLLAVNWEFKPASAVVILATFQMKVRSMYIKNKHGAGLADCGCVIAVI